MNTELYVLEERIKALDRAERNAVLAKNFSEATQAAEMRIEAQRENGCRYQPAQLRTGLYKPQKKAWKGWLSPAQTREMLGLYETGEYSIGALGRKFHVSPPTVRKVIHGIGCYGKLNV